MLTKIKTELKKLKNYRNIDQKVWEEFWHKVSHGLPLTKKEGNSEHICSFFVPFHRPSGSIYITDHIKAGDWMPPGGHIEPQESPVDTVRREFHEELGMAITSEPVELFSLSTKQINRPHDHCVRHFDFWHLVYVDRQYEFNWLKKEFHAAGWFKIKQAAAKITQNPDYRAIINQIYDRFFGRHSQS